MSGLRVPVTGLSAGRLKLEASSAHYVTRVHRLGPGDDIAVFDPEQRVEAVARIVAVERGRVSCEVRDVRAASVVADRRLVLLLGLTKSDAFEWAIREATALGVTEVVPVVCVRTAVPAPGSGSRRADRWRRIVVEGARQSGRGDVPEIHEAMKLPEALARAGTPESLRLCLWERASRPVRELVGSGIEAPEVALLVGPEGGLEEGEARLAEAAGYACVRLGAHVLRAETAVIAVLGLVRGMW
jgi:16S rRNA (uracil1498-N3)-methyltransferase